jgi:nicotinate-nucleotide pyrophosphorylase (carboxylating)
MDWKSRRIEAILEQALVEDKATSDVTTAITIEPDLRASINVTVAVTKWSVIRRYLKVCA